MQYPCIDFVVLWFDPNDPDWQVQKAKYKPNIGSDVSVVRYQEWDNFRYWFRAVAKYAPWVNKIHVVTCGQVPVWLKTDHPKIHMVKHSDYMPASYLPTFNSSAIEVGMHKIPDLAELFVYFNDDMFIIAPITPDFYFKNNVPVDMPGLNSPPQSVTSNVFSHILYNNSQLLQKYFGRDVLLGKRIWEWLNPIYGKTAIRSLRGLLSNDFPGFVIPHLSTPYCKKDFDKVWQKEAEAMTATQSHRFRCENDLNHFLIRNWRMCEGAYVPKKSRGKYFSIDGEKSAKKAAHAIRTSCYPEICINDVCTGEVFEAAKQIINHAFAEVLSEFCEFEKSL